MRIVRDVARRKRWAVSAKQVCFVCGKPFGGFGFHAEIAHILGASRRTDEEWNLTLQMHTCHASTHGIREIINGVRTPVYTLVDVLRGKRLHDPEWWQPDQLEAMLGHALPELD